MPPISGTFVVNLGFWFWSGRVDSNPEPQPWQARPQALNRLFLSSRSSPPGADHSGLEREITLFRASAFGRLRPQSGLGWARRNRRGGPLMRLTPRTAKAAPWGRRACARGSRRRGRAGAGRDSAATSRADRGAPPRDEPPPPDRARPPVCENNGGRPLRRRRGQAPIRPR